PTVPKLPSESDWEQIRLDQLRNWDWAPENAALLRRQGLEIALSTYGLADKKKFRQNLRLALERGLSEDDALAALTTIPAKLCGAENQLGTIEPGKLANLAVVDGTNYFNPDSKVREVWIDGRIYRAAPEEPKPAKEEGELAKKSSPEEGAPTKPSSGTEKKRTSEKSEKKAAEDKDGKISTAKSDKKNELR